MTGDDELLSQMFATDRDRGANDAAPDIEDAPEPQPDPKPDPVEAKEVPEKPLSSEADTITDHNHRVPLSEVKAERAKRQDAERRFQDSERRIAEYENYIRGLQQQFAKPQTPEKPPVITDIWEDPQAYLQQQLSPIQEQMQQQSRVYQEELFKTRATMSRNFAMSKHGDYEEAETAFLPLLDRDANLRQQFASTEDPAEFAYHYGKRALALERVGGDINTYEERVRKEERERVLAELRSNGGVEQPPSFPGTLSDASSSGANQAMPVSDQALMDDLYGNTRKPRSSR